MKLLLAALAIVSVVSCSKNSKVSEKAVPDAVKTTFALLYPVATVAEWDKDDDLTYEAKFKKEGREISVIFSVDGKVRKTEEEMNTTALPSAIVNHVNINYNNATIENAEKITDAYNIVTYEVEIKNKDLYFDANGSFIKEVTGSGKDKEDSD